jgi:dihydroorotase
MPGRHNSSALLPMLLIAAAGAASAQQYDLLLKGGHVIDAKNNISAVMDVAIAQGKIAAVAANIPASQARRTVDVSSFYVTPGLVDMHVHVFATSMNREYLGEDNVRADEFSFRTGVTTMVDAGCTGWRNFGEFRDGVINRSQTRVFAMLNIVGHGMGGRPDVEQNTKDMEPDKTAEVALRNKDVVVGIKVAHYAGPEWIAVDRGVEAGKLANIPVMVDFATFREQDRPFKDLVLKHLRPGDIYTHTYLSAVPMLDPSGKVLPYLFEARKRGVIFDVGHGAGSFYWRQAIPAIKQGFIPDSISTDLHVESMNAGMKDMMNLCSKFLNMGMPLDAVIAAATWHPARQIHHEELGNLSVGSVADVAVLRVIQGKFGFIDSARTRMDGTQKLETELTLRAGRVAWDLNGITVDDWEHAPARRRPEQ